MSAEISVLLDKRRVKRKKVYPLKLRVYHGAKTELYPTVYDMTEEDFNKLTAKRISDALAGHRDKINELVRSAQAVASSIHPFDFTLFHQQFVRNHPLFRAKKTKDFAHTNPSETIDPKWLDKYPVLTEKHPAADYISAVYARIVRSLLFQGRIGNASAYQCSYTSLKAFRGNIRFLHVTDNFLKEYEAWMIGVRKNSKTTVGMYIRALRAVFNEAMEQLKLISKEHYPFNKHKYGIPTGRNIKKALDQKSVSKLYYSETQKSNQQKAKDFWFFIFYGNGMNVKDMINLKFKNINGEFIQFERAKTELTRKGKEPIIISVYITEDMWRIIYKWGNKDHHPENYIFPILKVGLTPIEEFKIKYNTTKFINQNMKKLGAQEQLPNKPRTMEARHSFSTILKNSGVSTHFIKEALGHTTLTTTENYLGGFENEQKKGFSKVLESFKNLE